MEIIKSLNLNKNYKDVQNGSIVCAKNIITDDTCSYITTEPGLTSWFEQKGEKIVGVIPIPNGCIVFTYKEANSTSKTYIKKEGGAITEKSVGWSYEGGIVEGTYAYNYKGDLILAVNEYGVNNKKIPLKVFNLDDTLSSNTLTLNQEKVIPTLKFKTSFNLSGSLVCGCYTFFIRYKIYKDNYTKWFQITSDIYVTAPKIKDTIIHNYINPNSLSNSLTRVSTIYQKGKKLYVNENKYSNKSIIIEKTSGTINSEFQIGVIIRRDTNVVGRIIGNYDNNTTTISIKNNNFIEEIDVSSFFYTPTQYYNVKNAIAYNNRLYISNWEEYDNPSPSDLTYNLSFSVDAKDYVNELSDFTSSYSITGVANSNTYTIPSEKLSVFSDHTVGNSSDVLLNIIKTLIPTAKVRIDNTDTRTWEVKIGTDYPMLNHIYEDQVIANGFDSIKRASDNAPLKMVYIRQEIEFLNGGRKVLYEKSGKVNEIDHLYVYGTVNGENIVRVKWTKDSNYFNLDTDVYIKFTIERYFNTDEYGNYVTADADVITYYVTGSLTGSFTLAGMPIKVTYAKTDDTYSSTTFSDENYSIVTHRVNNRTLVPYQIYNFFIHFIRPDGSYTDGYRITPPNSFAGLSDSSLWKVSVGGQEYFRFDCFNFLTYSPNKLWGFKVSIDTIPSGYIGYFLTYEKIEETATNVVIVKNLSEDSAADTVSLTNTQLIYGDKLIKGDAFAYYVSSTVKATNKAATYLRYTNNKVTTPRVVYTISGVDTRVTNAILYTKPEVLRSIYSNEYKTLYRLTNNIYNTSPNDDVFKYAPGFYTEEKVINYDNTDGVFFSATSSYVLDKDGSYTSYVFKINALKNYSNQNLDGYSVKTDFQQGSYSRTYNKDDKEVTELVYNKVLPPFNLSDYLEIQPAYTAEPSKVYTNYSSNRITIYDKTVRRSNILSDESNKIGFDTFEANEYRNILENKGKIVNLVGLGLYFIVHTEYSMFVFDRSTRLTRNATLDIPDTFDVNYREVLYSSNGFGGLQDKRESIVTKHGYIWLDKLNNFIFRYDESKLGLLSKDINNFIKLNSINSCRFADDIQRDRLLTCLSFDGTNKITLSYNFNAGNFISLHDYSFERAFMSYYRCYLLSNSQNDNLYIYDTNAANFSNIGNTGTDIFADKYYDANTKLAYVDIIINNDYESPKTINAISYVLNKLHSVVTKLFSSAKIASGDVNGSDFEYINKYSGYKLQIFNDQTNTGEIDISLGNPHNPNPSPHSIYNQTGFDNLSEPYDKPWYDKGKWTFNYFRNIATKREISGSEENVSYTSVQDNSLIYGKYFIIRFYFDMSGIKPKLETINVNLNNY